MELQLKGISPKIDGCSNLILKKAFSSYQRLPAHHKRWLDPEDLLQESLLAALASEQKYRKDQHTKFSSYLFTGLDHHLMHLSTVLNQKKRSLPDGQLMELDAPVIDDSGAAQINNAAFGVQCTQDTQADCIKSFVTLCRAVSQAAIVVLVRGFLFSDCHRAQPEIYQEIGNAAKKLGIGISVFSYLSSDEIIRRKCLTRISMDVMMELGTEAKLRCLECLECTGQFSLDAVRDGRFFVSTMTCRGCYKKMQAQPSELSCFGKLKQGGREGYSEDDVECRIHCPDRVVCRSVSKQGVYMAKKKAVEDVDLDDVKGTVKETKPKGKKTVAATKKAKRDVEEEDELPVPSGMVRWPFKRGSVMRYIFQTMYKGCNAKELEKEIEKTGHNWKFMLSVMRTGIGGRGSNKTHTFKLNEDGGRYKISNVKYIGEPIEKAPAPVAAKGKAKAAAAGKGTGKKTVVEEDEPEEDEPEVDTDDE